VANLIQARHGVPAPIRFQSDRIRSEVEPSDDVRFERLAGWLADTAAAPQIPDVFAAVPKGVSLVPRAAVSTCNNVAYRRGTYSITSSTGAGKEGGTVMSSARVLLAQKRDCQRPQVAGHHELQRVLWGLPAPPRLVESKPTCERRTCWRAKCRQCPRYRRAGFTRC
jgi:hypothetical protein